MQANTLLSIVIPTYNRADFLDRCLEVHIPLARAHHVALHIFDNASTDATRKIVEKRAREYSLIQYHCNADNVGPDDNFKHALQYPETRYVWLLGDTYRIPSAGIKYILDLISDTRHTYDAVVFNLAGRVKDVNTQNFIDSNKLLNSLGALMTCLSCLVYSKDLIVNADFNKYSDTSFIQTGIIFEAIACRPFTIHWNKSMSVMGLDNALMKKKSWSLTPDVFNIAGIKWIDFVFSLPSFYTLENKLKCIIAFTEVSGVFSLKHLLLIRIENILNVKTYKQYLYLFPLVIKHSKYTVLLIALLPRALPRFFKTVQDNCRCLRISN